MKREKLLHLLNATPAGESATYEAIGEDLEDFSVEMNAQVDKKKNVLGKNKNTLSGYEPEADVDTYYAVEGTKTHEFLQDIIDNRKTDEDVKTDVLEVHLWEESATTTGEFVAFKDEVVVEVVSYGGDTVAYGIPYNLHYTNVRTKGTYNATTKEFTPTVVTGGN